MSFIKDRQTNSKRPAASGTIFARLGTLLGTARLPLSDLVPLSERGLYQGILDLTWAFASSIGPPVVRISDYRPYCSTLTIPSGWRTGSEGFLEVAFLYASFLA